ncbi:MAG: flagellar biosynthetic protein FliR [Ignavibacteria bacterium]|nr:flagellar biosynthetic protein FliR [Ignavibacteria bacterium]
MILIESVLEKYIEKLIITLIVFIRISGIFLLAPMFRMQVIPIQVKIFFALVISFMLASTLNLSADFEFEPLSLIFLINRELIVGLFIGFIFNLVFWGARYAGGIIDFELGFQAAMLLGLQEGSPSLFGQLLELMILMLFLFLNGHHHIFEALYYSYVFVPIGGGFLTELTMTGIGKFITSVTIIALKISAPIVVAVFLINISLAMLARMAPQTNIFIISFPLKILLSLIIFFVAVSFFVFASKEFLLIFQRETLLLLQTISS